MTATTIEMLRDIALFVEVARTGSFTRAADRLAMPLSSLSRRLAALERGIGVRLLHRTTRRVVVTEAGQAYYNRCSGLVDEASNAHRDLQALTSVPRGRLRVSCSPDFGAAFIVPSLPGFRRRFDEVDVDLDFSSRRVDLLTDPIDVAIRMGPLEDSTLIARPLASLRVCLYAAPAYLARRPAPRSARDLSRHACLAMHGHRQRTTWTLVKGLRRERVEITGPFSANSMGALHQLAVAGCGIVSLDSIVAADDVAHDRLVPVLPSWGFERVPVHALVPSRLMPAKTRVFVDYLSERLAVISGPSGSRRALTKQREAGT